ncbi:MAG: hypothetical protein ABIG46_01695 [Candidatus Omnitrophota bacterium]
MTKEKPFGIEAFGTFHITIGVLAVLIMAVPFFLAVFVGYVSDDPNDYDNIWGFFRSMVVFRVALIISFISAISLFWSGIGLLRLKNYSRKLTIISAIGINSILAFMFIEDIFFRKEYLVYNHSYDFIPFLSVIYLFILIYYFTQPAIKSWFSDEGVRFKFWLLAVIILLLLLSPLLFVKIMSFL